MQLKDPDYVDMLLDCAKEISDATGDDTQYQLWKKEYRKSKREKQIEEEMVKEVKQPIRKTLPLPKEAYADAKPNKPCPCGSGKKFKVCCGKLLK